MLTIVRSKFIAEVIGNTSIPFLSEERCKRDIESAILKAHSFP